MWSICSWWTTYAIVGRLAIEQLGLVSYHLGAIRTVDDIRRRHPRLIRRLGDLTEPYDAILSDNAQPYVETAPQRIPIPLAPKVKPQLDRMAELGVIRPVKESTDWCAGIIVVPKKDGSVRICVDLTHLNTSIKRETIAPIGTRDSQSVSRSPCILQARCCEQFLDDTLDGKNAAADYLHYPLRKVLFPSSTFWN